MVEVDALEAYIVKLDDVCIWAANQDGRMRGDDKLRTATGCQSNLGG
ncbi:hypothetical protein [Corynebacterium camporealensis]|nr:hypothetical protein [Corynebacterium camporealensis]